MWWSRHEIAPGSGIFTDPGQFDFNAADFLNYSGIPPASLAGKRVLDLGAFAGAMTFGRRGLRRRGCRYRCDKSLDMRV